jgi:hypothetical protein
MNILRKFLDNTEGKIVKRIVPYQKLSNYYFTKRRKGTAYARNLSTLEQLPSDITVVVAKYKSSAFL